MSRDKILISWLCIWAVGVCLFFYVWEDLNWVIRISMLVMLSILAPTYRDIMHALKRHEKE